MIYTNQTRSKILQQIDECEFFNKKITLDPEIVPLKEMDNDSYLINEAYIDSYCRINECGYNSAINSIIEANNINDKKLIIAKPDPYENTFVNEATTKDCNVTDLVNNILIMKSNQGFIVDYDLLKEFHKSHSIGTTLMESYRDLCLDNNIRSCKILIDESELLIHPYLLKYIPHDIILVNEEYLSPKLEDYMIDLVNEAHGREIGTMNIKDIDQDAFLKHNPDYEKPKNVLNLDDIEDIRMGRFEDDNTDEKTKNIIKTVLQQEKELSDSDNLENDGKKVNSNKSFTKFAFMKNKNTGKIELVSVKRKKAWLGRVIGWLRRLYRKWLAKKNKKISKDPDKANAISKFLVKLANIIDRLVYKLERKVS